MTRYLSLALGAQQPLFGQSIDALERASGRPAADIRLTSELAQRVRLKIIELGLDPDDTTGPELYAALQNKLRDDDAKLRAALGISEQATPQEVLSLVQKFVEKHEKISTFAIKAAAVKKLLRKKTPKVAMKMLGYRSLDSMLKHESAPDIYAAALMYESPAWHKAFLEQYAKLQPSDFEQRPISVLYPTAKKWVELAKTYVDGAKHNILPFKELGSIVMLPLSEEIDGLAITALLLLLYYLNDIHAYGSFAKLQQVKPTFGKIIRDSVTTEQLTTAELAGQPVSWKVIQQYYGHAEQRLASTVFEPHIQAEDLAWRDAEDVLAGLEPALQFWQDTRYTCMIYGNEPVSFNILDVALANCNHLSFADRIVHFAREHLWSELMGRYMHQGNLEAAVQQQLSSSLVDDVTLA